MRGRAKAEQVQSDAEGEQPTAFAMRLKTAQALALQARIVLAYAEGVDDKISASQKCVTPQAVSKCRARFAEWLLDGLLDALQASAPCTIEDAKVASRSPSASRFSGCVWPQHETMRTSRFESVIAFDFA